MSRTAASTSHQRAFTLIELSIVLVILGVLIGGILTGRGLIRAAELRSVMTEANNYLTAAANFRSQYRYQAGDMPNAVSYWSSASNGNADGQITGDERFQFWFQLNAAGMVEQRFSGVTGSGGANDFVLGSNTPASRLPLTGFAATYANLTATASHYAVNLDNSFTFGASMGSNAGEPVNAALTPTDAFTLDSKADDGIPGTGKWVANLTGGGNFGTATACSTDASGTVYTGAYRTTIDTVACSFFIMMGY
ncbi:MAG: prepilin-type N-terminal cleavage/methylation domain-containing protein [Alphaproteobacteria bacterium]|nr:prepilin-type N-terminal cleavage/methylation domain-containing protein [Alphaproteobacteria bacterium]